MNVITLKMGMYLIFFTFLFFITFVGFPNPCWYRGQGKQAVLVMKKIIFNNKGKKISVTPFLKIRKDKKDSIL